MDVIDILYAKNSRKKINLYLKKRPLTVPSVPHLFMRDVHVQNSHYLKYAVYVIH